ncbi:MAG: lipid II:glycine glycyltransferase FemX [Phototrophicaceae bacterium]
MIVETVTDRQQWNAALRQFPQAHVLQTWEWGQFKQATTGWKPTRLLFWQTNSAAPIAMASVLTRRAGPLAVMYVPKGPILDYTNTYLAAQILHRLEQFAVSQRAIWLKIDPDIVAGTGIPGEPDETANPTGSAWTGLLDIRGWRFSGDQVQFRNTVKIDLTASEDTLLAAMSQNTRRKVRAGEKHGLTVRAATLDDLPVLYNLYQITGQRDEFLIRPPAYYEKAWRDFMRAGLAHALIAEDATGTPLAHVILFHFGRTCWYFYGASSNEQREKMPNYLLQWQAMRWARSQGYAVYDLWGAPDDFTETDRLWGVYQFKRGFRGTVTRHIGAWDYAPSPLLYRAYVQAWPRLLKLLRRR